MRTLLACLLAALLASPSAAGDRLVTVTPEETDEILANPGMGWETFHQTAAQDKSLPPWIPSTVQYIRWGWAEVEPQPGELNTAMLDRLLAESGKARQRLAFRVMCCSTTPSRPYHPAWLKQVGGKELLGDYDGVRSLPIPDFDDPATLQRHLDFIKRLGRRYDGHPGIDHVDLGSIGWWGEWHMSGSRSCRMPSPENCRKVVDAYLAAFKKTPLLMLIGGGECLKQATRQGTGWRADCLGDMGGFSRNWCHMRQAYPTEVRANGLQDTWKTAPVAWESCWDMRKWVHDGWPLRFIFNYALALHGSYLNNKSALLPERADVRPELERFLRRLGYRLVLKELEHPAQVPAGGQIKLSMQWQNVGSAPCYKPYRLAYRLDKGSKERDIHYFLSDVQVNHWLPGSVELFTADFFKMPPDLPPGQIHTVADSISLDKDVPAGEYTLSLGVVDMPALHEPVVRLGIKGRAADGWYPLSKLQVGK
jgi:hypothetical protein